MFKRPEDERLLTAEKIGEKEQLYISQMLKFETGEYWGYRGNEEGRLGGPIFWPVLNPEESPLSRSFVRTLRGPLVKKHWDKETQTLTAVRYIH